MINQKNFKFIKEYKECHQGKSVKEERSELIKEKKREE